MNRKNFDALISLHPKDGIVFSEDNKNIIYQNEDAQYEWKCDDIKNFGTFFAKEFVDTLVKNKIKTTDVLNFKNSQIEVLTTSGDKKKFILSQGKKDDYPIFLFDKEVSEELIINSENLKDIAQGSTNLLEAYPELSSVFFTVKNGDIIFVSSNLSVISEYIIQNTSMDIKNTFSISSDFILNFLKFHSEDSFDAKLSLLCSKGVDFYIYLQSDKVNAICRIYKSGIPFNLPTVNENNNNQYKISIAQKDIKKVITSEKKKLPSALQTNFGVVAEVFQNNIQIGETTLKNDYILPKFNIAASDFLRILNLSDKFVFNEDGEVIEIKAGNIYYINKEI